MAEPAAGPRADQDTTYVTLLAGGAALGGFLFGFDTTAMNSAINGVRADLGLSAGAVGFVRVLTEWAGSGAAAVAAGPGPRGRRRPGASTAGRGRWRLAGRAAHVGSGTAFGTVSSGATVRDLRGTRFVGDVADAERALRQRAARLRTQGIGRDKRKDPVMRVVTERGGYR
jgi:hypothetical protein